MKLSIQRSAAATPGAEVLINARTGGCDLRRDNPYSGRSNAVGSVTLAVGASSRTVATANCSVPILVPASANAAAEVGNGTMYVSAVANGAFTIAQVNSATSGRVFLWAAVG